MLVTITICSCSTSNSAPLSNAVGSTPYPPSNSPYIRATLFGVPTRPSLAGSSPIEVNTSRTAFSIVSSLVISLSNLFLLTSLQRAPAFSPNAIDGNGQTLSFRLVIYLGLGIGSYGRITASITWITPFDPTMSVIMTFASLTVTESPLTSILMSPPCSVVAEVSLTTCSARIDPETT